MSRWIQLFIKAIFIVDSFPPRTFERQVDSLVAAGRGDHPDCCAGVRSQVAVPIAARQKPPQSADSKKYPDLQCTPDQRSKTNTTTVLSEEALDRFLREVVSTPGRWPTRS